MTLTYYSTGVVYIQCTRKCNSILIFKITKTSFYMYFLFHLLCPVFYFSLSNSIQSFQNDNTKSCNIYWFSSHCGQVFFIISALFTSLLWVCLYFIWYPIEGFLSKYHACRIICYNVLHIKIYINSKQKGRSYCTWFNKIVN